MDHQKLLTYVTPLFSSPKLEGHFRELTSLKPLPEEKPAPQNSVFTGGTISLLPSLHDTIISIAVPSVVPTRADAPVYELLKEVLGQGSRDIALGSHLDSSLGKAAVAHSFVNSVSAFNLSYSDAGLFGIHGEAEAGNASALYNLLRTEIQGLTSVKEADLVRAKTTHKSRTISSLLSNSNSLANFISQRTESPGKYFQRVDSVTLADIQRVGKTLASVKPNVVAAGDVRGVPASL